MSPYHGEFTRLKAGNETRKIARTLYLKASELTKPGSGRSLGQGQSALSAVCAFLASKRLGNGEITRDQACAVACVDPRTFESTLAIVESLLPPIHSSPRVNQTKTTYRSLLKQFVAREDAVVPMAEVEESLKSCELWVDGSPIDLESSTMQCAIFYWVCTRVLRVTVPDVTHFRQMLKVSPKTWSISQRVVESHCSPMLEDLIRKADTAQSARRTRSQGGRATLAHNVKHKMPAEFEMNENGSPPKRAKRATYVLPALRQELSTHIPNTPKVVSYPIQAEEDMPTHTPTAPKAHSYPNQEETTPTHTQQTPEILSYPIQEKATPTHTRKAPKVLSYPTPEETPRHRRRNLRAAFLNPGVYGWKPAAHIEKKLERARKWETLMIGKYGDPWDAW